MHLWIIKFQLKLEDFTVLEFSVLDTKMKKM